VEAAAEQARRRKANEQPRGLTPAQTWFTPPH
jgi:hypothetical protein